MEAKEKLANKEKPKGPPPGIRQYMNYRFKNDYVIIFITLHRRGAVLAMSRMSACPPVRLSVKRMKCTKRKHPAKKSSIMTNRKSTIRAFKRA